VTTTIIYAETSDGHLLSKASSKVGAVNGTGTLSADSTSTFASFGLDYNSGDGPYQASEAFLAFINTAPVGETITSAQLRLRARNETTAKSDFRVAVYDWGATVGTGDWRTAAQLAALTPIIDSDVGQQNVASKYAFIGYPDLRELCASTATLRLIIYTQAQTSTTASFGTDAVIGFSTTEYADGTTYDPALIYTSAPTSTLLGCLSAQAQLSDGTWAAIEGDGAGGYTLVHIDAAGSTATIASVPIGSTSSTFAAPFAAQGLALVADTADDLFVVGRSGSGNNILAAKAYASSGSSWTAKTLLSSALPATGDEALVSQVAAGWNSSGTNGTIFAVAGYEAGDPGEDYGMPYALLDVEHLLAGSGALFRASGSATDRSIGDDRSPDSYCADLDVGTNLDVVVPAADRTRGYVVAGKSGSSSAYNVGIGYASACTRTRYILGSAGTSISQSVSDTGTAIATDDGAAKVRAVPIDDTRFVLVAASATYGITVEDVQNIGWGTTLTTLGSTALDGEVASLPAAATLAASAAWDAVYDSESHQIWVYYFDTADGRNLLRTSVDLSTHLAVRDEVVVDATVGDAGSTNQAIRCTVGERTGSTVMITVANKTAGGVLSTIYVPNVPNQAPTAPTLVTRTAFDADDPALFEWIFNDPDVGDAQSAYQLVITAVGAGSPTYDSTKLPLTDEYVTLPGATLTNAGSWLWNVTTWDGSDAQSPVSTDGSVSTSATGTVDITDPAADNPAGLITSYYDVVWSVTGTTQAAYRVQLTRTDTSSSISDSGWLTGVVTTRLVEGLISDVACRVDVTVRDALAIETNTASRLLTASYASPDTPTITVVEGTLASDDDGPHIVITVTNPVPTGSRPDVTTNNIYRRVYDAEASSDAYTLIGQAIPDGEYSDYTAAGGVIYEYYASAVAVGGGTTDSASDTGSLTVVGVWLHDSQDPSTTSRQYPYSGRPTSLKLEASAIGVHYVGRSYPVFDFGESEDSSVSLGFAVPFGPDWATDLARLRELVTLRRSVVARDGRGRSLTGAPSDYTESDEPWGTSVSLTVTETDTGD
jgi:hypothetical protein